MHRQKTMSLRKRLPERRLKGDKRAWYKSDALPRAWRCIIEQRVGVRPHQSITERRAKEIKGDEMGSYDERDKIVRFHVKSYKLKSKGHKIEIKLKIKLYPSKL